jgi:hypothetical protein
MDFTKNIKIIFLFLSGVNIVDAQNSIALLEKVNNYYKTVQFYNVESTYNMYRGFTGKSVTESYKGTMYKNGQVSVVKVLGQGIIMFENVQLIVNDADKTITYTKNDAESVQKNLIDVDKLSKYYDFTSIKDDKKVIIYEMTLKNKDLPLPYSKLIFHINKTDNSLVKQELFFATKLPFKNKDGEMSNDNGRMEIIYNPSNTPIKNIKLEDYITTDSKDRIHLSKAYKNYQLIDQTYN